MRDIFLFCTLSVIAVCYAAFLAPPASFPAGAVLKVEQGQSITSVAEELRTEQAIRSVHAFILLSHFFGGVQAGWYSLATPEGALTLALRVARGDTHLEPRTVTIPEGTTVREISLLLESDIPRTEEGYLFPDTYEFLPGTPPTVLVSRMRARYEEVLQPLRSRIAASPYSEHEIITMASILEKEARLPETRRIVAGILWKRLERGMPLQVDAVFGYIRNTDTYSPTFADLEIDSPYNTYKYTGLPPGPINNPGLGAIEAALEPTKTPYLYYLTGKDGTMHYARTFDEHVANRRFLR